MSRAATKELLRKELPVLRERLGISQESLAEKIGVSRQTYNSIETGKREMTWTTLLALIAFFQNNQRTKPMIEQIEGLNQGLSVHMAYSEDDSR